MTRADGGVETCNVGILARRAASWGGTWKIRSTSPLSSASIRAL